MAEPDPGGRPLGRYLLGDELGAGGMATVYRARDTELRRDVAVKVLFPQLARKDDVTKRFHREARAQAALEHGNILRVYDVGTADEAGVKVPYIVMELVRGTSLREVAEARAPLLAELVACLGALVCDALAVAHRAGVIHRDVKPGNVLLADDGRLLLADFGVARLEDDSLVTRTGSLLGTVSFMPPEQGQGDVVDARSDLYALGVSLYQLGTGSLPFTGAAVKILADAAKGALPAERRCPAIGAPLSRLIARLMAPDPAQRPAGAAEVATELRALAAAGGLDEPADELRAFAADQDAWIASRTAAVVRRVVERAEAAAARREVAAALSLCNRALAMAPDDAAAAALVTRLTNAGDRRRRVLVAAGAVVAIAAAGGGAYAVFGRGGGGGSGGVRVSAVDAAMLDADANDDANDDVIDASVHDAASPDAAVIDARPGDRIDARVADLRRDAGQVVAIAIDAAAEPAIPIDAARPIDAAAPATVAVTFAFDTWCNLTIDGAARGRADRSLTLELAPGSYAAACAQGLGEGTWSERVTIAAGAARRIDGSLVAPVVVVNELGSAVRIREIPIAAGASAPIRPGRVRVVPASGGQGEWVTLPGATRCTLRRAPALTCD